jgi:hypothetical protein
MGRHGGDVNKFCCKLSCGCFRTFRYGIPKIGDELFCPRHNKSVGILIPKVQWRLLCYNCAYVVNTGLGQDAINDYASKHVSDLDHSVHVWQDGGPSYIVTLRRCVST